MKRTILMIFISSLFILTPAKATVPADPNNHLTPSMAGMLKNILPAVVNITVRGDVPIIPSQEKNAQTKGKMQPSRKFETAGSGVVVDKKNGYIVTNSHVIRYGKVIIVTLGDGRMLKAKIIGIDPPTDIAVIQVQDKYLNAIPLSDSSTLEPGDFVAAIGNPFGLHQTVTSGVVSALNRSIGIEGPAGYENFIQTDASINPGNSGGALVDMNGNLIGINTAILGRAGNIGIGFAIPSNMVKTVMEQLIKYGHVKRGVLGVMVQTLTPDLADAFNVPNTTGALVTHLQDHSAAKKAGVKEKDIILTINNTAVKNAAQLRSLIGLMPIDSDAKMQIKRGKENLTITAKIQSLEELKKLTENTTHLLSGLHLNNIDQVNENNKAIKGVIILKVNDESNAWLAGLRPGDVIVKVNDQNVENISELMKIADKKPEQLLLTINRAGATLYMVIS